jgi:hypothetical protein
MNEQEPKKAPFQICEEAGEVFESTWKFLSSFNQQKAPERLFLFLNEAQLTMAVFEGIDTEDMLTYDEYANYRRGKGFSASFWKNRASRARKQLRTIHEQIQNASFLARLRYLLTRKLRLMPEWERPDATT